MSDHPVAHATFSLELAQWFSTFDGPIDCEVRDLRIAAGQHVAFCH